MMATFFKNYVELDKTVKNLVEQYRQAKTPENVVRLTYENLSFLQRRLDQLRPKPA